MSNILSKREYKMKYINLLKHNIIKKELYKISTSNNIERKLPMAVFANEWIGINIYVDGIYEKEHIKDFFNLLETIGVNISNTTMIDIGANIGNHTLQYAEKFKKVISFEPNPRTFALLKFNTKDISNVFAYNYGCGSKREILRLGEIYNNIGSSSVMREVVPDNIADIKIIPLDDMFDDMNDISAIKIDVEGMEIDVLKGAEKIINRYHPIICFEQHAEEFTHEHTETPSIQWLRQNGYKIYALKRTISDNLILRRLRNIYHLFFGINGERVIVEYKKLPKNNYEMIYAVHNTMIK